MRTDRLLKWIALCGASAVSLMTKEELDKVMSWLLNYDFPLNDERIVAQAMLTFYDDYHTEEELQAAFDQRQTVFDRVGVTEETRACAVEIRLGLWGE